MGGKFWEDEIGKLLEKQASNGGLRNNYKTNNRENETE